jgi:hypothetical protein
MRIITGDECGVLKESIPELSRCDETKKNSHLSIEDGVMRIGELGTMQRSRAVVDLAVCDWALDDTQDSNMNFCALRVDGSLERWNGYAPYDSKEDRICGGSYKLLDSFNLFEHQKKDANGLNNNPGRPLSMCSAMRYPSDRKSSIVACCSSMGSLSVVDLSQMDKGVKAQYSVYAKAVGSKISYTKGHFVNRDIISGMAMGHCGEKVAVGGRERAATIMDLETGKQLWKVRRFKSGSISMKNY